MDTASKKACCEPNEAWAQRIKEMGADFVSFVDISDLPEQATLGFPCAVLFGKSLSKEYIATLQSGGVPKHKEVFNTEHKMDALAVKVCGLLQAEGYESIAKLKTGVLPHKTVALRAGLGFIGKNNLLVTPQYGCAVMLGKVLTSAPFALTSTSPRQPQCGDCTLCTQVCPSHALLGKTWDITVVREEIITRKLCSLCLKCMVFCPYTKEYTMTASR